MNDKSVFNRKYYEKESPYPIRLGELKEKLQKEAFEKDKSIHFIVKKIISDHFEKKSEIKELIEMHDKMLKNLLCRINILKKGIIEI